MTEPDDLQRQLLTFAGSIMEDASAIVILSTRSDEISISVSILERRITDLAAIARVIRLIEAADIT